MPPPPRPPPLNTALLVLVLNKQLAIVVAVRVCIELEMHSIASKVHIPAALLQVDTPSDQSLLFQYPKRSFGHRQSTALRAQDPSQNSKSP